MRILPLEYLTVTFSSKMATSEQRHDQSCQFVSTQLVLSLDPRPLLCRQCPSGLQQVEKYSSVHFTLNSTCSHPKVLSTCKIRLIENSVHLLQSDKDLFLLGH